MQQLAAPRWRAKSVQDERSGGRTGYSVGIIVPVYGHSEYLAEALTSAVSQQGVQQSIVVVIDGCRHPETYLRAFSWASQHDNVTVLVQRNSGLSSARNSGLEYFRQSQPDLDFIYFLDADNSLGPNALNAAARQLANAPQEVAWVYPDLRTTGIFEENLCAEHYSRLAHLNQNVCEAGSLMRADVLWRCGLRFDEKMRAGYEDWDFWLQHVGIGYKGAHCPGLVLNYRRRPSSMLASSVTMDGELRSYLRRKHATLYQPKQVLQFDRDDAPRYLSYVFDDGEVRLHHHPAEPREVLSIAQLAERIRLMQDGSPAGLPIGTVVCFSTSATYAALTTALLSGALLHRVERLLGSGIRAVTVSLVDDPTSVSIAEAAAPAPGARRNHLYAISCRTFVEVLNDNSTEWLMGLLLGFDPEVMRHLEVTIPSEQHASVDMHEIDVEEVLSVISKLRRAGFAQRANVVERPDCVWGLVESGATAAAVLRTRAPYNNARPGDRPIAAVTLPISAFGGAERVAHQMARVLREEGFYTQLFVAWDAHAGSSRLLRLAFDEIVPLGLGRSGAFSGPAYLGTATFSDRPVDADKLDELYSCLLGADVVINCHVPEVHVLATRLRRHGIMTIADLHVFDLTPTQRPIGHPYLAVAYEHGYARMAVPSSDLAAKLLGLGVPGSKIVVVANSVGVPEELITERSRQLKPARTAEASEPLRCLFAGRLDRQKGIDRLVNVIAALKRREEPVSWTVIGGNVLSDGEEHSYLDALVRLNVTCKPAVYDEQELVEELSEADVLVLPSYFEGLPLVLVEAMRLGLVPVATRVGGVAELITDGVNGFLVDSDANTEAALTDVLARLARMPRQAVAEIGRRAAADTGGITWAASMAPLVADIREHFEKRTRQAAARQNSPANADLLTFGG